MQSEHTLHFERRQKSLEDARICVSFVANARLYVDVVDHASHPVSSRLCFLETITRESDALVLVVCLQD